MAFGFNDGANNFIHDKGFNATTSPNILLASFGDGYEQRLPDGINNTKRSFQVSYKNRVKSEIEDIVDFFELKAGVTSFPFRYDKGNGSETEITVRCPTWAWAANHDPYHTVTATFQEVFEP